MAIHNDEYRFLIGGQRFYPASKLSFTWEPYENEIFSRMKISELKFIDSDEESLDDFDYLWNLENSENKCSPIPLTVDKWCNDAWSTDFFKGNIHLVDGKWNMSNCIVDIPVRPSDKYSCVLNNWENPVNVFEFVPEDERVKLGTIDGDIEYKVCAFEVESFGIGSYELSLPTKHCLEAGHVWWELETHATYELHEKIDKPATYTKVTTWVREVYLGSGSPPQPIEHGWVGYDGKYYRKPQMFLVEKTKDLSNSANWKYDKVNKLLSELFDNGIKFDKFMEVLCDQTCGGMKIRSKFFEIDSLNDGATDPYIFAKQFLSKLVIYQKSDIKNNNASQNATSFAGSDNPLTLKKILDDLKTFQGVYWDIEKGVTEDTLILEHISYFVRQGDWDLTQEPFDTMLHGAYAYSYKKDNLPKSEEWEYMDEVSTNFKGLPIVYNNGCVAQQGQLSDKKFSCKFVTNDIPWMVANSDEIDNSGVVFVTADDDYNLIREDYIPVINKFELNGALSFYNLLPKVLLWERPQIQGMVNNQVMLFYSQATQRKIDTLEVHLCCQAILDMTMHDKHTRLGWNKVVKITLEEQGGIVKFDLEF